MPTYFWKPPATSQLGSSVAVNTLCLEPKAHAALVEALGLGICLETETWGRMLVMGPYTRYTLEVKLQINARVTDTPERELGLEDSF